MIVTLVLLGLVVGAFGLGLLLGIGWGREVGHDEAWNHALDREQARRRHASRILDRGRTR